jgi:Tol biopolymer transport system component
MERKLSSFLPDLNQGSHEIFLMSANGDPVEQISNLYETRAYISNLMWSPAGNRIILTISNYRGGLTAEIFSIAINTRKTIRL